MSEIKNVFDYFGIDNDEMLEKFSKVAHIQNYKANADIYIGGTDEHFIFINLDGIQRAYVLGNDGLDLTYCFNYKFAQCMATNTFSLDKNVSLAVRALTHSTLIVISENDFWALCNEFAELEKIYNDLYRQSFSIQSMHKFVLTTYTAEQKYLWFLENHPGLIDRIPHKYIASFLNITPVTLSRTRSELKQKEDADSSDNS